MKAWLKMTAASFRHHFRFRPVAGRVATISTIVGFLLGGRANAEPLAMDEDRAVALALEQNSELAELEAAVAIARARLADARRVLRSNPEIEGAVGEREGVESTTDELEVAVALPLEIFGQRGARKGVASSELDAAESRRKAFRAALAAEVREAFARALAAAERTEIAQERMKLARQAATAAALKLEAGDATRIERNAAVIELARATRETSIARAEAASSLSGLRMLIGETAEFRPVGNLREARTRSLPSTDALVDRALQVRADLAVARHELEAAHAERRLAGRERFPVLAVGASYAAEESSIVSMATVRLDLPILDRNQAGRGIARARLTAAEAALSAHERRVREEILLGLERLSSAEEAAAAFRGAAAEAMTENALLAARAYEAGKLGLADLLVLRREALEARLDAVDAFLELRIAEGELARAVGDEDGSL